MGWWVALAAAVPALALAGAFAAKRYVVPRVLDAQVRDAFAALGFPAARFRIVELGLDHVRLADASLGDGLELGEVTLDTGIAALWGHRAERVAIRGAHVAAAALASIDSAAGRGAAWPRLRVDLVDCSFDVTGARVAVSGTLVFDPDRPVAAELAVASDELAFPSFALRRARVEVHAASGVLHARGEAELVTAAGSLLELGGARVAAAIEGELARPELDVRAELDAADARIGAVVLDAVHAPFVVRAAFAGGRVEFAPRGELEAHARSLELALAGAPLRANDVVIALPAATFAQPSRIAWRAARACWRGACFDQPAGTLAGAASGERRRVRWRAASASWAGARFAAPSGTSELDPSWSRGEHELAWARVAGPGPIELGAGSAALRTQHGEVVLSRAAAAALGGELVLAPFSFAAVGATPVRLSVRGVALDRVLAALGSGVRGTGLVDGELALRVARGIDFTGGWLRARGGGRLELGALGGLATGLPQSLSRALHERIVAALASFTYTQLAAVVGPDLVQLSLHGRGIRVPQDLDVVVNLHGVRDAVQRLPLSRLARSSP